MSKKTLQVMTGVLGAIPTITGVIAMMGVSDPIYAVAELPLFPMLDSNLRFFGGVWLALGLAIFWMVPRIDEQTVLFRVIWGAIFVGGIGRLISMFVVGMPPVPFVLFTLLEIVGAPAFVYWQSVIAQASKPRAAQ